MSNRFLNLVFNYSEAKKRDRLVLIALANRANENGICWPSKKTIAQDCNTHPDSVKESITRLEELGEITADRKGGRGRTSIYRIILKGEQSSPLNQLKEGQTLTPFQNEREDISSEKVGRTAPPNPKNQLTKQKQGFSRPSIGEIEKYAHALNPPLPKSEIEKFFHYNEATGWRIGNQSIQNWEPVVCLWHRKWLEGGGSGKVANPMPNCPTAKSSKESTWGLNTRLKAIEERLEDLRSRSPGAHCDLFDFLNADERAEFQKLLKNKKEITARLTGAA